jgi:uncharacterized protein
MISKSNDDVLVARRIGLDPGILGLTVFPTEKCNFRCVYCYEDFPNNRISDAVAQSIFHLIDRRIDDIHYLSLGWFGGEPLLEAERVIQISEYARRATAIKGVNFRSHMTSNGYLLHPELLDRLMAAGVSRYQISLDGVESEHNQTRRMKSNRGTFSEIFGNLIAAAATRLEFEMTLRLHLHGANLRSIELLFDQLATHFNGDNRFKINLQPIRDFTGDTKQKLDLVGEADISKVLERLSEIFPDNQIVNTAKELQCCYASMPNHFVIRANGKVQKCTVALYDEINDIGALLPDGTFEWFDQDKLRVWSAGLLNGDLPGMACPWSKLRRMARSVPIVRKSEV